MKIANLWKNPNPPFLPVSQNLGGPPDSTKKNSGSTPNGAIPKVLVSSFSHTSSHGSLFALETPKKNKSFMLGETPKRKDSAAERTLDAFASKYVFFAVFLFFNKGMCEK